MDANARLKIANRVGLLQQPSAALEHNREIPKAPANSRGPSLLMKAYALALKNRMSIDAELQDYDEAIFVAGIQNKGIPIGVAEEFINEQIYQNANSMQDAQSMNFQTAHGDFFQYLNDYILAVHDDAQMSEDITPDLREYYNLLGLTEQTFEDLMQTYKEIKAQDPQYGWQDHVSGEQGSEYRRAWHERDIAASKLPTSGVSLALKIFDSSHARVESRQAQNMPCCLKDPDLGSANSLSVDPKDVIFRPFYSLPGFISKAEFWRDTFYNQNTEIQEVKLDLKRAAETPWKVLGFGHFDSTSPPIAISAHEALKDYQVSLCFKGMEAFRVTRGIWNIEDFRDILPLKRGVPARLKNKQFRTNTLLLGYGVQIKVQIPDDIGQRTIFPELLSGVSLSPQGGGLWVTDVPHNDAFPVLLAALGRKC